MRTKMMRLAGLILCASLLGAAAQDISVPPSAADTKPIAAGPVATSDRTPAAGQVKPTPRRLPSGARTIVRLPPMPTFEALGDRALTAPLPVVDATLLPAPGSPQTQMAQPVAALPLARLLATPRVVLPAAHPATAAATPSLPAPPDQDPSPDPVTALPAAISSPSAQAVPSTPAAAAGPAVLAVRLSPAAPGPGFLVPFEPGVGAAAFRRGPTAYIVFDQRRPFDLAALRGHPLLAGAYIQLLPGGTVLRLPLPADAELAMSRVPTGWQVTLQPGFGPTEPIRTSQKDSRLFLAATAASAVVAMTDPETGATLLIGTQNQAGQATLVNRNWPNFSALRSWLGLAIEPLSDSLSLRVVTDGFALSGGPEGLAISEENPVAERMAQTIAMTRSFNLPGPAQIGLLGLERAQLRDAGNAPALARGPKRRALGETLIALGLGVEAHAVLQIAAMDDPREADTPETIGLIAVAALLAGRLNEAAGLDEPRLDGSDEIRFWRAVRAAMRPNFPVAMRPNGPAASAADDFAATLPLLRTYPVALQERLTPLVAETLLLAEQNVPVRALLAQLPDLTGLAYARALLLHADGQTDKALAQLDAIAAGRDRLARAKATTRAVEIRLARGDLSPAQAADALDRLLLAWRGDMRELALRLRVAELRAQAGIWRQALALLRDTEAQFPEDKPLIEARLRDSVALFLRDSTIDSMAPLDLVALMDENAVLMPGGAAGVLLAARLADRLTALDLPRRALPLLQKLVTTAPSGPVRAQFGASLAAMRLREADATGALTALDSSAAADLPAPLAEDRTIIAARARARLGDAVAAISLLANLDSDEALRARAVILEDQRNWPQATEALRALIARIVPTEGALDDQQQRSLLRLATAAAQAGDSALLAQLRDKNLPRLTPGTVADLFRLLTADSIQDASDLPRSGRELALARALSAEPGRR